MQVSYVFCSCCGRLRYAGWSHTGDFCPDPPPEPDRGSQKLGAMTMTNLCSCKASDGAGADE